MSLPSLPNRVVSGVKQRRMLHTVCSYFLCMVRRGISRGRIEVCLTYVVKRLENSVTITRELAAEIGMAMVGRKTLTIESIVQIAYFSFPTSTF